jgi:thiol-disulfide isomerase/thioredoxin
VRSEEVGRATGTDIGQLAPDFTLTDLQGEALKLSDFRGLSVLINFWASTCPYCREEMPMLQRLSEKYPELVVIGINVLEERDYRDLLVGDRSFVSDRAGRLGRGVAQLQGDEDTGDISD